MARRFDCALDLRAVPQLVPLVKDALAGNGVDVRDEESILLVGLTDDAAAAEAEKLNLTLISRDGISLAFKRELTPLFPECATGIFSLAERALLTNSLVSGLEVAVESSGDTVKVSELLSDGKAKLVPLHDAAEVEKLQRAWVLRTSSLPAGMGAPVATVPVSFLPSWAQRAFLGVFQQPIDHVRETFGEGVALYFAFLGYYGSSLMWPALGGLVLLAANWHAEAGRATIGAALYAIAVALWSTLTLKTWRRTQAALSFRWGTLGVNDAEAQRPGYVRESITKRLGRWLFFSMPLTLFCCSVSIAYLVVIEHIRHLLNAELKPLLAGKRDDASATVSQVAELLSVMPSWVPQLLYYLPTIAYSVGLPMIDKVNARIANWAVSLENLRTETEVTDSRISKLALLQLVNNLLGLFYTAFYLRDLNLLRERLSFVLIISQVINNVQETLLPFLKARAGMAAAEKNAGKRTSEALSAAINPTTPKLQLVAQSPTPRKRRSSRADASVPTPTSAAATLQPLPQLVPTAKATQVEIQLEPFDTFSDMLEMLVQFAMVALFSSVYPLAALFAFVNNCMEIRTDAFKALHTQRPLPQRVASLGAWLQAFDAVSYLALVTNVGLCTLSLHQAGTVADHPLHKVVMAAFAIEHALIVFKWLMEKHVADVPDAVKAKVLEEAVSRHKLLQQWRRRYGHSRGATMTASAALSEAAAAMGARG